MRSAALLLLFATYLPFAAWRPFCGVLLWTWVSLMNPHRIVWGIAYEMPIAMLTAVVALGGWFLSREPKLPPRSATTVALIGLLITVTLAAAFAMVPDLGYSKWDRVYKSLLMAIFSLTLLTSRVRIHAFTWVIVISIGYYGVKGGLFAILTAGSYRVWGPPDTMIYDNNHLAAALIMIIPLMQYLSLQSKLRPVRIGLMGAQLLSLGAILFSYSRGALLGLVAMGGVLWLRSRQKLVLALLLAAVGAVVLAAAPAQWYERMASIQSYDEDSSAMGRLQIWETAIKIALSRPLLGAGFKGTESQQVVETVTPGVYARAVHNSHLEVLAETGMFSFGFHLLLIVGTLIYGQRIRKMAHRRPELDWARDLASMLQVSVVGYVAAGTFLSLGYYDGWYSISIVMGALHIVVVREVKGEGKSPARFPRPLPLSAPRPALPATPAERRSLADHSARGARAPASPS